MTARYQHWVGRALRLVLMPLGRAVRRHPRLASSPGLRAYPKRSRLSKHALHLWAAMALLCLGAEPLRALCREALAAEQTLAQSMLVENVTRTDLKIAWRPLADRLTISARQEQLIEEHRKLVFALRAGSPRHLRSAINFMKVALPECFGLDPDQQNVSDVDLDGGLWGAAGVGESGPGNQLKFLRARLTGNVAETAKTLGYMGLIVAAMVAVIAFKLRRTRWRRAPRFACRVPAQIATPRSTGDGRLINISEYGAQIQCIGYEAEIGDAIEIRTSFFNTKAEVMWTNTSYSGVRFNAPVTKVTVATARSIGRDRSKRSAGAQSQPAT